MKSFLKLFICIFLVLLTANSALAHVIWDKEINGELLLAWSNGELEYTIEDGERATFSTGYFTTDNLNQKTVLLSIYLNDYETGRTVSTIIENVEENVDGRLAYKKITLIPEHYQTAGKYRVIIKVDDGTEVLTDLTLTLTVNRDTYPDWIIPDVIEREDPETVFERTGPEIPQFPDWILENRRPIFTTTPDQTVYKNEQLTFTVTATDPDGDDLTYQIYNLPDGASFTNQQFTWTPTSAQVGQHQVVFMASDGELFATDLVIITVQETHTTPIDPDDYATPELPPTEIEAPQIDYGEVQLPDHVDIPELPDIELPGESNTPPDVRTISDKEVDESSALTFTVEAKDADQDQVTFEAERSCTYLFCGIFSLFGSAELLDEMTFDQSSGKFVFKPGYDFITHPDEIRNVAVRFRAFDGEDYSAWEKVIIKVNDVNRIPQFAAIASPIIVFGDYLELTLQATDADPEDTLQYSILNLPTNANLEETLFQWDLTDVEDGNYELTFTVTDGISPVQQTVTITVFHDEEVIDTDNDGIPDVTDNCPLVYNPDQLDSDNNGVGDACEIPIDSDNDGIPDTTDNCPSVYNPDQTDANNNGIGDACEILPLDTDSDGVPDEVDNCLLVYNPDQTDANNNGIGDACEGLPPVENDAPKIISEPLTSAREGDKYEYQIIAIDANNDILTYRLLEAPSGMSIDTNGLVSWRPDEDGKYTIRIVVSDGYYNVYQEYTLTVRDSRQSVRLSSVTLSQEELHAGEVLSLRVNVDNNGNKDLEELRVNAVIYDLNLIGTVGEFDLDASDAVSKNVYLQIPYNTEAGDYLIKVKVWNDHYHKYAYRLVTIW